VQVAVLKHPRRKAAAELRAETRTALLSPPNGARHAPLTRMSKKLSSPYVRARAGDAASIDPTPVASGWGRVEAGARCRAQFRRPS